MEDEYCEGMLPSRRDKKSGRIYRLRKNLERKIDEEYDAAQAKLPIKIEAESDDEPGDIIWTATGDTILTNLMMTCSDEDADESESSSVTRTNHANKHENMTVVSSTFGLQSNSAKDEMTVESVMSMFNTISKQITKMNQKTDRMRQDIANISDRLGRVENKMGISLQTLEQVKDSVLTNEVPDTEEPHQTESRFEFSKISSEEELVEFDRKLGTDKEYYSKMLIWLRKRIHKNGPHNRMHMAIDLMFDRVFFGECTWTGASMSGPKIPFGIRTNILKLFGDIGSNKFVTMDELKIKSFFMLKLRYAKIRATRVKGLFQTSARTKKFN